jgi:hypothetical protein
VGVGRGGVGSGRGWRCGQDGFGLAEAEGEGEGEAEVEAGAEAEDGAHPAGGLPFAPATLCSAESGAVLCALGARPVPSPSAAPPSAAAAAVGQFWCQWPGTEQRRQT